jgi:hypothetical protein
MTKQEVDICDDCKKTIAIKEFKCELCGADSCINCKSEVDLNIDFARVEFPEDNHSFIKINTCSKCSTILTSVDIWENFKNYPDLRKQFIEIFQRLIQLEELEGNTNKPKKDINGRKFPHINLSPTTITIPNVLTPSTPMHHEIHRGSSPYSLFPTSRKRQAFKEPKYNIRGGRIA